VSAVSPPFVSVVLAVHDDADYLPLAVRSILRQTLAELELIVVDDASTDETPTLLSAVSDPRALVLRNDEQLGLAASLNRGLDNARGRYVARLDADDVAAPGRLARQVAQMKRHPEIGIVGAAVLDLDAAGRPGRLHRLPGGATAVRWHALFGAPFFHPTVLVDRELLESHGLRYDPAYLESEDYDLWTRLLAASDGGNLQQPLVFKRVHAGQASVRRGELQTSFQRVVALREIARIAPELGDEDTELAWRLGSGQAVTDAHRAAGAYARLLDAFERRHGTDRAVRRAAARALARRGEVQRAARLSPALPLRLARERAGRGVEGRVWRRRATTWLDELSGTSSAPLRVAVVSPEPTPYRSPLFDRIAERPDVDLTVIYAARTVAGRGWSVQPRHRSVFLRGIVLPGLRRVLHHEYPVTPGIRRALRAARPDVVVVSGWSTFAAQAAIAWCRAHGVPYVLLVESHDLGPRAGWRRVVKAAVVPRLVRAAAGTLAVGTLARDSLLARGAPVDRVRIFANTIDVTCWSERARELARRRRKLRGALAFGDEDFIVLSVARLAPEKGLDTLLRAAAEARVPHLAVVVAGSGAHASTLMRLADDLGVRLLLTGELPEERLAEAYVAADVFALLSGREPWGVVVNEAAASELPLVLSDRVGAAPDLLRDGENGFLVPAGDAAAAASAVRRLADDSAFRDAAGARSRELVAKWDYDSSVESFVAAVRDASPISGRER
jgi:glycosyltransferase involved in cell wall biosynthesis/GT2 family glycosyltransferase